MTGIIDLSSTPGTVGPTLADRLSLDPFYVSVWCQGAVAAGICDRDAARYRLAPHIGTLLLGASSPAHVGAVFGVLGQYDVFDRFEAQLASGERMWWNDTSHDWIAAVAGTGRPFYTRLVPSGLQQIPGLSERLVEGARIVDTACGSGIGLLRLAEYFPTCEIVGVDGDGTRSRRPAVSSKRPDSPIGSS